MHRLILLHAKICGLRVDSKQLASYICNYKVFCIISTLYVRKITSRKSHGYRPIDTVYRLMWYAFFEIKKQRKTNNRISCVI